MKYAVVTGTSKGLGESVARLFLESDTNVIGVSRNTNKMLSEVAEENNKQYHHLSCDLAAVSSLEGLCLEIMEILRAGKADIVYLVNNAATVEPIDQAPNIDATALAAHFNLNAVAPMVLTNRLLKELTDIGIPLITAIITSGAAEAPVYGWSAYCSSKASLNMYTKTVALEQRERNTENRIVAFSPGIMDTGMQGKIRASSESEFAEVGKFQEYKKSNLLKDTDLVAGVLIDILLDENLQNGEIYYAKNYL